MDTMFLHTKDNDYEIKLTTRSVVLLEKKLGKNPISLFVDDNTGGARIPEVGEVIEVLFYALNPMPTKIDTVYDIVDAYLEDNSFNDLIKLIVDMFKACGILPKEDEDPDPKNA